MNAWVADLLSNSLAQRVAWALIHFLWQGAAVALVLGATLQLVRGRSAQIRWVLCCGALALMAALPVVTACMVSVDAPVPVVAAPVVQSLPTREAFTLPRDEEAPEPAPAAAGEEPASPPAAPARVPDGAAEADSAAPQGVRLEQFVRPALPWSFAVWVVGVVVMSVWHLGGWLLLERTKRHAVRFADGAIRDVFDRLLRRLRVSRPVRLLQSARVAVPTVAGWLRPVVLLPASALSGLSIEQIEAILAHELAHVRRYDCLVRLIQAVVETLLFYHPAVWWVSGWIRQESEHCCDDAAVAVCGSRVTYARALAGMEDSRAAPAAAAAASGGCLLDRIRRIVGLRPGRAGGDIRRWGAAAAAVFVLVGLTLGAAIFYGCGTGTAAPESHKAVGPAKTQGEALRLARQQDLPAIRQADRLVIKMSSWAGSKQVVVRNPPWLAKINSALVLRQVSPSGGKNWAALTWYKGDKKIRAAWVFNYGEWGFERPSTDWTLGRNQALVKVIREALAEPTRRPASGPATQPVGRTSPRPKTEARAKQLKANIDSFHLDLSYYKKPSGVSKPPSNRLILHVKAMRWKLPLPHDMWAVQVTKDQARKIVDHLANEGFLERARASSRNTVSYRTPGYVLWVRTERLKLYDSLGWDLKMLRRVQGLRKVLEGDAAKAMDKLLALLGPQRLKWEQAAKDVEALSMQRLQKAIAAKLPNGWAMRPVETGEVKPVHWPEGEGLHILAERKGFVPADEKRGLGGRVRVWIMGKAYSPKGPQDGEAQAPAATEIERWRGHRVLIWGTAADWKGWREDIHAALKTQPAAKSSLKADYKMGEQLAKTIKETYERRQSPWSVWRMLRKEVDAKGKDMLPGLVALVEKGDERVGPTKLHYWVIAAYALGDIGDKRAAPFLAARLRDPYTRRPDPFFVKPMGQLGVKAVVPRLVRWLQEDDREDRSIWTVFAGPPGSDANAILEALQAITGKDFGTTSDGPVDRNFKNKKQILAAINKWWAAEGRKIYGPLDPAVKSSSQPATTRSAEADSPQTQPAGPGAFGPVTERVVAYRKGFGSEAVPEPGPMYLDLDTGAYVKFKVLPASKMVRGAGVDVYYEPGADGLGMRLARSNLQVQPLSDKTGWDSSPKHVWRALMAASPYALTYPGRSTLAFKTGDGGFGILQILGFTKDRRGIRIRYKLVQRPKAGRSALEKAPSAEKDESIRKTAAEALKRIRVGKTTTRPVNVDLL